MVFYFYLAKSRIKGYLRTIHFNLFQKHSFFISSVIYFSLIVAAALFLHKNFSGNILLTDPSTLFITIGATLAGVLAIVFSFSTLLMQNAAQQSSAGLYEIFGQDWFQKISFWTIAFFSLLFFVLAILSSGNANILSGQIIDFVILSSLVIVALVLWFLYLLYKRTFDRIKPQSGLKRIQKDSIKKLDKIAKVAAETAVLFKNQPGQKESSSHEMATAASFQILKPWFNYINVRLDHLFDYHDKLLSQQEKRIARQALTVASNIIHHYLKIRGGSSVILRSPELFFVGTSDSQDFLTPNLEQFVSKGEVYIKNNDGVGVTHVISILMGLAISARHVRYVSHLTYENPIFEQCRGYFDQLVVSAIKHDCMEALFQSAGAYTKIGLVAIDAGMQHEPLSIFTQLDKIAYHGLTKKMDVVWGEVIKAYTSLFKKLVASDKMPLEVQMKSLIEHLQAIILSAYTLFRTEFLRSDFINQWNLSKPYYEIESVIFDIARAVDKETDEKKRDRWKKRFIIVVEELRRSLRHLSEQMQSTDHQLIDTFGKIIAHIGCFLLELSEDKKWQQEKSELISQAGWYLHQPEWFVHHAEKINSNLVFDELVESVTKIGICALKTKQIQLAKEAIEVLSKFAIDIMAKEKGQSFGFTEPRIMERACYISILAVKLGQNKIIEFLKQKIDEFQKAYEQRWFSKLPKGVKLTSPKQDQLKLEIMQLRDKVIRKEFDRGMRILDSSEERIIEEIEVIDFDRFTYQVWGFFESGSPLEEELKINKNK